MFSFNRLFPVLCILLPLFCQGRNGDPQKRETTISLEEVVILSKEYSDKKIVFNTNKVLGSIGDLLRCEEAIGIYVPRKIDYNLRIEEASFPIKRLNQFNEHQIAYDFFLMLEYPSGRQIIPLDPATINESSKKITVHFNTPEIALQAPIAGYYFFFRPICNPTTPSGYANLDVFYTRKLKSSLTYKRKGDTLSPLSLTEDFHVNPENWTNPNWKVKLEYYADR